MKCIRQVRKSFHLPRKFCILMTFLFSSWCAYAEGERPTKIFNNHQYVFIDSVWKEYSNGSFFKVNGSQIIIKYNQEVDEGTIDEFEISEGLTEVYKDERGYHYYHIAITSDIFSQAEAILGSEHVTSIDLPTEVLMAKEPTGTDPCTPYYMTEVEEAWTYTIGTSQVNITGSPNVKVAVIDGGFWIDHPDIGPGSGQWGSHSNWYYNPGESGGGKETNGLDDDNNGYIDDYLGWNFSTATQVPPYPGDNNVKPNPLYQNYHGTAVASIIAAKSGNGNGIDGVAGGNSAVPGQEEGVKIIPIKIMDQLTSNPGSLGTSTTFYIPIAVDYAVKLGADVINMSFEMPWMKVMDDAMKAAKGKNAFLVSATGNSADNPLTPEAVLYPACGTGDPMLGPPSGEEVVAVGGYNQHLLLSKIAHTGAQVDLAGPVAAVCVLLAPSNNNFLQGWARGTSFASAFVSGVAALMRSANPCLHTSIIEEIMKLTAYKDGYIPPDQSVSIPYDPITGHSDQFGYGRVRTDYAVKAAKYLYEQRQGGDKELFIKDTKDDIGLEDVDQINEIWSNAVPPAYQYNYSADNSPDIWVRNTDDGGTTHQAPDASLTTNVVYVRVRNIGCAPATTYDVVELYWSNAASWTSWPTHWDGTYPSLGNQIGWQVLTTNGGYLMPGQERIYKFPWDVTVPYQNGKNACLMARIVSSEDPIDPYTYSYDIVNKNNNIAMRNLQIVKPHPKVVNGVAFPPGGFMDIVNALPEATNFDFNFKTLDNLEGQNLTSEAEVSIKFDQDGWEAFNATGQLNNDNIELREDEKTIIMKNGDITFSNISIPANTRLPIYVGFNFLTDSLTEHEQYTYSISQRFSEKPDERLGTNSFLIKKEEREPFQADAGPDKIISPGQTTNLLAQQISELATYNWYGPDGKLVYTGSSLVVSPEVSSTYRLEVIASEDGFKDYDEANVLLRKGTITNMYPNPTTTTTTVQYSLENVASAYIMVMQPFSNTSNNFILDVSETSGSIDLTGYPTGIYNLILVCDGVVSDLKSIQKL